jgi:hypothetical protein
VPETRETFDDLPILRELRDALDAVYRTHETSAGGATARRYALNSLGGSVMAGRLRTRRQRLWAAVGASGTALVAGGTAAILLLSSGASVAYAGWSPVPLTVTPAAVASVTEACNKATNDPRNPWPSLTAGQAVLSEARGQYTAVVYLSGSRVFACITNGSRGTATQSSSFGQRGLPKPGADQITDVGGGAGAAPGFAGGNPNQPLPESGQHSIVSRAIQQGSGVESDVLGTAGSDVIAVTFDFTDGLTVDATVQNGWYFAWWPTLDDPASVQITATSGQTQECSWQSQGLFAPPAC